jgi:lipopolysaccharide/colanic/teichoic acid biosynthesis glycosyltransferase
MPYRDLLADPLFSGLIGLVGLLVLFPLLFCVAMIVFFSVDQPRRVLRRVPLDHHPLKTVLLFNTRCRIGELLRRLSLHSLPVILSLFQGQVTMLEVVEIDWREFPR